MNELVLKTGKSGKWWTYLLSADPLSKLSKYKQWRNLNLKYDCFSEEETFLPHSFWYIKSFIFCNTIKIRDYFKVDPVYFSSLTIRSFYFQILEIILEN